MFLNLKYFKLCAYTSPSIHFLSYSQRDPCALNMFGLLLEREGLLSSAKRALESAMQALLSPSDDSDLVNLVRLNLGRVCCRRGEYAEAEVHFAKVAPPTFDSLCGQALAMCK